MKPLYDQATFDSTKVMDKLPLECEVCAQTFWKQKRVLLRSNYTHAHCSSYCTGRSLYKAVEVTCKQCETVFTKPLNNTKRSPNHFCCKSCAATYNNTHKTKGTRRSKLEVWLEEQLATLYPNLDILYCDKQAINGELDIYVPSLRLAFELNGIYHYEPIHGQPKLDQVQSNDHRKFQACIEYGIELVIMDTSQLKYFKPLNCQKYLDIIKTLIDSKL